MGWQRRSLGSRGLNAFVELNAAGDESSSESFTRCIPEGQADRTHLITSRYREGN